LAGICLPQQNFQKTRLSGGINNNIYLTGDFSGSIDFDPGIDTFLIIGPTSAISSNAYISVFDKNIDLQTVINTGSAGSFSTGGDLKIADDGRIFAVGAFSRTIDLNPGSGEELVTAGSQGVNTYIQVFDSLGSYQSGLINFIQSFVSYVPVAIDFDDVNEKIVLAHEILGGTQASIRIYGDCAPNFVNESIEACYSYEMNGSILTSDCIITSVTEDPQTGCETITNTNLNIYTGNDISVQSSDTSVYTTWNGQAFQWLDCSEAFDVIPGATDQSFEPIVNGIYSIELTNSNGRDRYKVI